MAISMKDLDLSFQGIGQKVGLEKWRVENGHPVLVSRSDHNKFYSGDSYIVLKTTALKSGALHHDIHYWIGKDANEDSALLAATKGVELDAALGGRAVQHREAEGFETDKFFSYFKPCFIPINEGISEFRKASDGMHRNRLFLCKGRHVARIKEVPFSRSSLNHDNVFILDTEAKIFQFNGVTSNKFERLKSLEVVQYIKEDYHGGECDVAVIEDGKLVADVDSGEFWNFFGGFAPLGKRSEKDSTPEMEVSSTQLFCVIESQTKLVDEPLLRRDILDSNKCFILDLGVELYTWLGRSTSLEARKSAASMAEKLTVEKERPCHLTCIIEGFEPLEFKKKFDTWPQNQNTAVSQEGRGKVAVLLKQKSINIKGLLKANSIEEEPPLLLNDSGKLQVWRISHDSRTSLPLDEHGKFYSDECYLVLYTYHGYHKEEYLLCTWIGSQSASDTQAAANEETKQIAHTLKEEAAQVRVIEGKEPALFLSLFDRIFCFKGEINHENEENREENEFDDDDFTDQDVALFEIRQPVSNTCQAIQAVAEAASLSSSSCFILQIKSKVYTWFGKYSKVKEQELTESVVHSLKPGTKSSPLKEGSEPEIFWRALGGRKVYPSCREEKEASKNPLLYTCMYANGFLKVTEVFNLSQDDLISDEMMILDCGKDIFVWVGHHVKAELKQKAFEVGQKYLEDISRFEGISLNTPLYKIPEGREPSFFTYFFSWDPAKVHGDPFQRKLSAITGQPLKTVEGQFRRRSAPTPPGDRQRVYKGTYTKSATPTGSRNSYKSEPDNNSDRSSVASLSTVFDNLAQEGSVKSFTGKNPSGNLMGRESSEKDIPMRDSLSCPPTPSAHKSSRSCSTAVANLSSTFDPSYSVDGTPPRFPVKKKRSTALSVDGAETEDDSPAPTPGMRTLSSIVSFSARSSSIAAITSGFESQSSLSESSHSSNDIAESSSIEVPEMQKEEGETDSSVPETKPRIAGKKSKGSGSNAILILDGIYVYDQLKASSSNPIKGIDVSRRESYLSTEEFKKIFHVEKETFYKLPKWKQDRYKMMLDLF